jgi:hypothetical protein
LELIVEKNCSLLGSYKREGERERERERERESPNMPFHSMHAPTEADFFP